MSELEIYFNDLTDEAQRKVLDFYNVDSSKDLNIMDIELCPLAIIMKEDE